MKRANGRAVYGHVITKFSGMGRFTYPWCSASRARGLSAIKFQPSSETRVKGVFYFILWTVSWFVFCFNSSVSFATHFCWLVIRLGSEEGIGRGASHLITNRKKVAETEKKNVNLDGNFQAPNGKREYRQLVLQTLKKLP